MQNHILSIILFTPLLGALLLLFVPKENKDAIRWIANIFALGRLSDFHPAGADVLGKRFEARPSSSSKARPTTGFLRSARVTYSASTAFRFC